MTSTLLPSFPAVDDVLFNFAQSDGLSQANQVNSARNQRLTATVVFLDAGVSDYQSLQAGVIPEVATVILSPKEDGVEQITAFLQQNPQITTIHLVSHGAPGCLYLGNCQLNLTNIYDYRQQLQNWAKINRILLYGCQVAAGDAGTEFINKLSQITGAKIAASSRRVGNAALGGSWELEVSFPAIKGENKTFIETLDLSELQTSGVFQPDILNTYPGVFAPTLVGVWDRLSVAYGVTVVGNYAYAVGDTLEIIDISNPSNPTFKGNYDIYEGQDVQIVGNYAYVADWGSGLQIIDISNPTTPTLKGNYDTSGLALGVQIVGNYAYVADGGGSGLQIIDISNPTTPTLKGNYNTSGYAIDVQIVGNYAYVADGGSGLQIIDISNPTNPTFKGNYDTPGYANDVQVVGNYAYVADDYSGLQIIDISNPTNPTFKGNYNTSGQALGVQIVDNYAYVADGGGSGLQIIDISNPTNPIFKGNYDTSGYARDVQIVGNYAYVADWNSGLQIIDISNPTTPTLKGNYDTSGIAYGVQIVGNYAYVADAYSGLQIIDISNPTNPTLKGNYDTSGGASGVQIVGNYAYVADGGPGLQIIDISNPTNPTFKGNYNTSGYARDVQVVGDYAYVADDSSGLQIIDISNPTNPTLKGNYNTSGYAYDVQIVGNYAYIADWGSGLQIIDISNPTNPTLKGNYNTSYALDVQIVGNYAYVADLGSGLQIIDISNPTNPTLKGNYDTFGQARDVQVVGNYAYVADGSGLQIIDISNPTNPTLKGNYDTSGLALGVQIVGNYAYVADGEGGLKIIDVSEFTNPQTVTLSISPSSVSEDGTANMAYTFTRSGVTTDALTVNYTVGGTATFSTDYTQSGAATFTSTTGTVTFAANATTAKVTIDPTADTIVESNETVILTLAAGTGYTVGTTTSVTGTITNDDTSVTLAVSPASVTEDGTTNLIYTFTRSGLTTNPLTVNYTLGGTATLNTDYTRTGTNNTVTFAAGSSTATVTVDPTPDTIVESNETVILTLAAGTGYTVGTTTPVTGTITNDDTSVTLAVSPASVTEDGTTNLIYTFTRSGLTTNPLTVNYTLGGTATLNTDYTRTGTNNTVTFAAGSSTATVTIDPTPDTIVESDETVILTLAAGTGYTVGTTTPVTGTITNDDTSVTLAVSPASVTEDGTTNLIYTFTRSGLTTNPLTVNYTLGGTATLNTDYTRTGTNNTVTFAAGSSTATVTVDPTPDTIVESDETVILTLAAGTGYTVGTTTPVTGTITNVTLPSVTLAVSPSSVTEDGTSNLIYIFMRTGDTTNPLTVNYSIGGTATNGNDYTLLPTSVIFEANSAIATVMVDPTPDTTVENNETVALTLAAGTGYTIGTTNAVTGTITNDDTSVTLAVSPASVTEDGTTNLIYTFTRSGVTTNSLTVNYSISGTATNGNDYTLLPTSVTFAANATTATVTVDPTPDTTVETDETVALTLAAGTGYTIGTPDAVTGTITNDDLPSITLAISPSSVTEDGTSNLIYTFTRTGDTTNPLTVNYTVEGTATNGNDYTLLPTSVTFAANSATATVTVDPTPDTIVESDETVILTLASGTGYTVGTTTPVTGTINNDDFSQLSINNITVVEGLDNNAILTVTVDNPNPQPISFNYTTGPIDATADVDYTSKTGTITIAANTATATISIPLLNDNLNEPDEVFTVTLSNPVNATINPEGGIGEVIITDTWQTSLTRTLPNNVENLRLISSNNVNGTGNAGNNKITGNSGINQINGANGADTLTGGLGADTFVFQFGQSTISTSDRITDFAINSDKIDLLTQAGNATSAPSNFSRAANSTVTTLQNLINQVFTDANGAITGNQGLGVNSAALVQVTTGAIAGTYLVINDSTAGFQSSNDLLINITGFTGTLPALGNITVGNFFV
ncbi:DUF4347 domain-containing protein [Microcystis flos-aquae FACHB-1344]|uniref:DUF4347 domain-containing protein n=2 Tax=Microcystis TaxID=1125 RepID=A0ABR8I0V3_9CHRO|nr:Calx-beta domain-containing protein [Microcystis flos-aquae]MBD2624718.1 DUF4347 domain-containing protein [Microcystis flos-aquae FACHB-1344]